MSDLFTLAAAVIVLICAIVNWIFAARSLKR